MVQSLVYDLYQLLKQLVHREFGLKHFPENKPGFGYHLDVIGVECYSALICTGHSTRSHGIGPGWGCWRPRVLGSIRDCGDNLNRVASVACILVAFSHSAILLGSCAAPREISVA